MSLIKFSRATGKYGCFSNFDKVSVTFDDITYGSSEAAWQAQKTLSVPQRWTFAKLTPSEAKREGRHVQLRPDWERVKYDLMVEVLKAKFAQHADLRQILLNTGDAELMEDTTGWHDNTWGSCSCDRCKNIPGQNLLGKALMATREVLRR